MITLGLNAAFHDSAAALVIDGVPVAAAEEERFSRIKHAKRPLPFTAWELPFHAAAWCLEDAGLTLAEVDHVAYSFEPALFAAGRTDLQAGAAAAAGGPAITLPLEPWARRDPRLAAWDSPWDPLFMAYMVNAPGQLADGAPHHLKKRLQVARRADGTTPWRWHYVSHHLCHQASAFLAAPFERCAVMTLDGRGERATTTYGVWRDGRYRSLGQVEMPHSLGMLYEQVTGHLGFLHSSDEYKVMALAAMGRPVYGAALAACLTLRGNGRFEIAPVDLSAICGAPRVPGAALEQRDFDLAASLQQLLETTVLRLAEWLREASGEQQLAMAGGVALNCVMNARLRDAGPFESIWVQPAAGDAGTALGAALWIDGRERLAASPAVAAGDARPANAPSQVARSPLGEPAVSQPAAALSAALPPTRSPAAEVPNSGAPTPASGDSAAEDSPAGRLLAPRRWRMDHAYLGPAWADDAIEPLLRWAGLAYERMADDAALVARGAALLERGCILGWFQGRMEWGPRALGARSILASPIDPAMQQRLNELKDREDFRPVAPAVTAEAFADWFSPAEANGGRSPFMLFTHQALPGQAERIPSACHSDGSARVQTVHADSNPRFHALLTAFAQRTGVPVLVNTSFNVRGLPVVCSPKDALEAFFTTPLDALLIGRFVLVKPAAAERS